MDSTGRERLVRRSIDAWNADDWEDRLRAIWSPEGTIVSPEGWPESGEFRGWPAMLEQWRRVKGSWAEDRVEVVDLESIGDRAGISPLDPARGCEWRTTRSRSRDPLRVR